MKENPYAAAALMQRAHEETDGSPEAMLRWLATAAGELADVLEDAVMWVGADSRESIVYTEGVAVLEKYSAKPLT